MGSANSLRPFQENISSLGELLRGQLPVKLVEVKQHMSLQQMVAT